MTMLKYFSSLNTLERSDYYVRLQNMAIESLRHKIFLCSSIVNKFTEQKKK